MKPATTSYKEISQTLRKIGNELDNKYNQTPPFKGHNFMTPNIAKIGRFKNLIWFELSYGVGIDGDWMIGVTLADKHGMKMNKESGTVYTFEELSEFLQKVSVL